MEQFRHGDLLIVKVDGIPEGKKRGDRVLALGEVTGHAHVLDRGTVIDAGEKRFVDAPDGAAVTHEEHARIDLAPGKYEVIRQRRYSPEGLKYVAD